MGNLPVSGFDQSTWWILLNMYERIYVWFRSEYLAGYSLICMREFTSGFDQSTWLDTL